MKNRLLICLIASMLIISNMSFGAGAVFAKANDSSESELTASEKADLLKVREEIAKTDDIYDYTPGQKKKALAKAEMPTRLDLRNYNGQNYVTPIKCQAPFGNAGVSRL